jgi:phosphatidylinositol alpha-mannosyltransferase
MSTMARQGHPLRIALVSPYDFAVPGGVTTHIVNLAARFRDLGHSVHILAPSSTDEPEHSVNNFHRVGKTIVPLRSNASIARVSFSLTLGPQVKRILRENDFDVIHLHEPMAPLLPWYVLWHSNCVNVATFHASRETRTVYRTYKPFIKRMFKRLHGKIAVSRTAKDFVWGSFKGDYRIIPNGIDVGAYSREITLFDHLQDGKFNVLFVGRLEKRKGLPYLLDAMEIVQKLRRNTRLIVVGAFADRQLAKARRRVKRCGLTDVLFEGFASEEDKIRYFKSADLFCAPAKGDGRESQGLVLLEAMAAGTPVVASDLLGYRTVSPGGSAALYVPPEDPRALARAILRMMDYPETAARYQLAGSRKASEYSWEVIAEEVMGYYRELLRLHGGMRADRTMTSVGTLA